MQVTAVSRGQLSFLESELGSGLGPGSRLGAVERATRDRNTTACEYHYNSMNNIKN